MLDSGVSLRVSLATGVLGEGLGLGLGLSLDGGVVITSGCHFNLAHGRRWSVWEPSEARSQSMRS